ncbi:ribose-phosphate diphosphokinase [Ekhidna sp.]
MEYLNLDPDFTPFGKSIAFDAFTFNGGEPHIKIKEELKDCSEVMITARVKTFNDFGFVLVAVDALKRMKVQSIQLTLPYFPGARQDRIMISGEPLTVKVYADLINTLKLDKVIVFDPHSEVTPALLDNVEVIHNYDFVGEVLEDYEDAVLIAPDGGALKKIYSTSKYLGGIPVVECGKSRDVKTGELSGFKVYEDDLKGKTCIVVDDICDGGGTFIGLAKELKKKNAGDLILAVSHGIFSHGFEDLLSLYKEVFTTDSFSTVKQENIKQIKLNQILKL